jgi:hypothetical protein
MRESARRQGRQPGGDVQRSDCLCRRASRFPTEVCTVLLFELGQKYPDGAARPGRAPRFGPSRQAIVGKKFGDPEANPLLVSVRSGARASMPGMMDTVLNLGLNDVTVEGGWRLWSGDARFAYDSAIAVSSQMYSRRRAGRRATTISKTRWSITRLTMN